MNVKRWKRIRIVCICIIMILVLLKVMAKINEKWVILIIYSNEFRNPLLSRISLFALVFISSFPNDAFMANYVQWTLFTKHNLKIHEKFDSKQIFFRKKKPSNNEFEYKKSYPFYIRLRQFCDNFSLRSACDLLNDYSKNDNESSRTIFPYLQILVPFELEHSQNGFKKMIELICLQIR